MESSEEAAANQVQGPQININLGLSAAEHLVEGLLSQYDTRAQMAGRVETGAVDMGSDASERITFLLGEIDRARQEDRISINLNVTKREVASAKDGLKSLVTLGPARGRIDTLLEEELDDAVRNAENKKRLGIIALKLKSLFGKR